MIIGTDIGGSHCTAALIDIQSRTIVDGSERRSSINSKGTAGEIIRGWTEVIRATQGLHSNANLRIGIAMPGPFDYDQGISKIRGLDKYENLYGLNVKSMLAEGLGVSTSQIRMNNDAACFLQGEMFAGAGRGYHRSIGITLGTGAGSAIYRNGRASDANLGPSPFLDSIADNYLSTRWFVGEYKKATGQDIAGVREMVTKYGSDPVIRNLFSTFATTLSIFLRDFALREEPEVIVMGGNISLAADYFLPEVERRLNEMTITAPIVQASLGEKAIILGAASLFL